MELTAIMSSMAVTGKYVVDAISMILSNKYALNRLRYTIPDYIHYIHVVLLPNEKETRRRNVLFAQIVAKYLVY